MQITIKSKVLSNECSLISLSFMIPCSLQSKLGLYILPVRRRYTYRRSRRGAPWGLLALIRRVVALGTPYVVRLLTASKYIVIHNKVYSMLVRGIREIENNLIGSHTFIYWFFEEG